ncbi:MAG: hypothetical protein WCO55_03670 [Candidatus Falkowbacteria bacterium]
MGVRTLTNKAYKAVVSQTAQRGSTTYVGEERRKKGEGLHPLVDPAGFGTIRFSKSRKNAVGPYFVLSCGIAMLEETRLDTTGSMGNNVSVAMKALPKTYDLLASGPKAVLGRYDTQMITSIFGDAMDEYILDRSQAEMDEKIAEQMTMMYPEGGGYGNGGEDPQYGLFGAAYLTNAEINKYGLKYYDFTITDEPCREFVTLANLKRVFGDNVMDKVKENGHEMSEVFLPSTKKIIQDLQKNAHAFLLGVGLEGYTKDQWEELYGAEYVINIPMENSRTAKMHLLPELKAAIIGLTEGVLTLQNLENYLVEEAKLSKDDAAAIKRAVAGIPIGAQAILPNFDKIPLRGATFAIKDDLEAMTDTPSANDTESSMWL